MTTKAKGMTLEDKINKVNLGYRKKNQALIVKKSTPLKVTSRGISYQTSTVDYSGIYQKEKIGVAIAFDAKECANSTSFPLTNIESHQILFLEFFQRLGGDAFILLNLTKTNKYYKIPISFIIDFKAKNTRKSIPFEDLKNEWLVEIEDYLKLDK
mgnify:CR=1 FL=1